MPVFGDYNSINEIDWSEDATIHSAISISKPTGAKAVIKVSRYPGTEFSVGFFEAARVQKEASEAGCPHLAPIFDFGVGEDDHAWYVTRQYDGSLAGFLKRNSAADKAFLLRVTDDILAALEELQRAIQRPHGNLKLSNVLLDGRDPRKLHACLTDMAPEPNEIDFSADLVEVGHIIYQLVRRNPRLPKLNPPLEMSAEWTDFGGGWLALTNRLLTPAANTAPDAIAELRRELRKLRKGSAEKTQSGEKIGGFWKIVAAVLALGAVGSGTKYYLDKQRAKAPPVARAITTAEAQWVKVAWELCQNPPKELDEDFRQTLTELASGPADGTLLDRLQDVSSAAKWQAKRRLDDARSRYQDRGWGNLCSELDRARADLDFSKPIGAQLKATAVAASAVDQVDGNWAAVQRQVDSWKLEQSELTVFEGWAKDRIARQTSLQAAASDIARIPGDLAMVSAHYDNEQWRDRLAVARFRAESPTSTAPTSPANWEKEARQYLRLDDKDRGEWESKIQELEPLLAALPEEQRQQPDNVKIQTLLKEREPVGRDLVSLRSNLATFRQRTRPATPALVAAPPPPMVATTVNPAAVPSDVPSLSPPPAPAGEDPETKALRGWLQQLAQQAKTVTTVSGYKPIFDGSDQYLGEFANQPKAQRIKGVLAGLLQPPPPAPPVLGGGWTVSAVTPANDQSPNAYVICKQFGYSIPFVRVESPNVPAFYMAGIEMPVGFAIASKLLPAADDSGKGPQVWPLETARRNSWAWKAELLGPMSKEFPGEASFYTRDVRLSNLSEATPLNAISANAAQKLVAALQCELPSLEQWKAAERCEAPGVPARLRGTLWKKQFDHWKDLCHRYAARRGPLEVNPAPWPDDGSYATPTSRPWDGGNEAPPIADGADDSALWFREVTERYKNPGYIYDLKGNVAEFVKDGDRLFAIGGSAISNPTEWEKAVPVKGLARYSDVGIRLVARAGAGKAENELVQFSNAVQQQLAALPSAPPAP